MKSRINHTGRKRILRSSINIAVDRRTEEQLHCRLSRNLDQYKFENDSPTIFECYYGNQYLRIPNGTVGNPPTTSVVDLSEFATAPKLLFRLKVLNPDGSGKLAGLANQIPLTKPGVDDDTTGSLVRVRSSQELEQQVWDIEYDEKGPVLRINEGVGDWRELVSGSSIFLPIVLPQMMCAILSKILIEDQHRPDQGGDSWQDRFIDLSGSSGNRPFTRREHRDTERSREWIDDIVAGFSSRHSLANKFIRNYINES